LLGGVAFFLLTAAGATRGWVLFVVGLQVLAGILHAVGSGVTQSVPAQFFWVWTALNALSAAVVTGSVLYQVRHTNSWRCWLALVACVMGLGFWLHNAAQPEHAGSALPAVFHLYAFFIFVVWKLVSLNPNADLALANSGTPFGATTGMHSLSSVSTHDGLVSLALRAERQRISHEIHDNICSQIVSILCTTQAAEQPQKHFLTTSLEQCLADLKMTVDALDSFDESVTQAMGRLRYRVQPALDRQGTQMHWNVEMSSVMDAVNGVYAQQVLRIAQESLANVMRHAKASSVKVSCCFVSESGLLLLEVSDDGAGCSVADGARSVGRGIQSMKRRAAAVGGFLNVSDHHGGGTCVRLTLPLPHLQMLQKNT
jgi:signal transduction histidine kinase